MRAAIYARFSTDRQSETSVEDQFRVCERLAEREGFEVLHRFDDRGISGGTAKRPGYQELLRAARRREVAVIVAEDLKRLWREQAEQWRAIKELIDLGVAIVTASGIDSRQQNFEIIASVIGAAGELERKEAAYRTRRGLEGRAVAGRPTGGKAYGYIAARDSGTGQLEINESEAAVVRRIFEMYADGTSPRSIAAKLNEEGILSPGAAWGRTVRRRDAKWLASAIHGEEERGSGILNNRRYVGVVVWGRTHWRRGAADSSKRHRTMNVKPLHEAADERLRIVPQSLWDRVKARQAGQRRTLGARVKGALRRNAPGAGRPSRYPLSGLLRCAECGASYSMADGRAYACASHINGAACTNTIRVSRTLAEDRILASVKADLRSPEVIAEAERRFAKALAERMRPDPRAAVRVIELEHEVENLVGAIAGGMLKASPALALRLATAEDELARLKAEQQARAPIIARIAPRIAERFERIVTELDVRLQRDPDRSRAALIEAIGPQIVLRPDESRRFLWAEYGLEEQRLVAAVGMPEIMVAGARVVFRTSLILLIFHCADRSSILWSIRIGRKRSIRLHCYDRGRRLGTMTRFRLPADELEYAVLAELWELGTASVRELHDRLGAPQGLVYTTTAKVVDRLREKGLIQRQPRGNAFEYRPRVAREEVERARARNVVSRLLGSSPRAAVAALVEAVDAVDPALLDELERAVAARRRSKHGA